MANGLLFTIPNESGTKTFPPNPFGAMSSGSLTQGDISSSPFDSIRHLDSQGQEYWYARELQTILGYDTWRRFSESIDRAKIACGNIEGKHGVATRFVEVGKTVQAGAVTRELQDYRLDRYAWYARELQKFLNYSRWDDFEEAIKRAKMSIHNAGMQEYSWLEEYLKPITSGKGRVQKVTDYRLNRYSCYVIAMNGDPRKPEIAAAQTYFAVKTRQAEVQQQTAAVQPKSQLELLAVTINEMIRIEKETKQQFVAVKEDISSVEERVTKLEDEKIASVKESSFFNPLDFEGNIDVTDMAEILGNDGFDVGRNKLFRWMTEQRIIRKRGGDGGYQPYKEFETKGYIVTEVTTHEVSPGVTKAYYKIMFTNEGARWLYRRYAAASSKIL